MDVFAGVAASSFSEPLHSIPISPQRGAELRLQSFVLDQQLGDSSKCEAIWMVLFALPGQFHGGSSNIAQQLVVFPTALPVSGFSAWLMQLELEKATRIIRRLFLKGDPTNAASALHCSLNSPPAFPSWTFCLRGAAGPSSPITSDGGIGTDRASQCLEPEAKSTRRWRPAV